MKRPERKEDGKYHIKGKTYKLLIGSRPQVWHETAYKTPGQLTKDDLLLNKHDRIVSKKKFHTAKKEMRLKKYGYSAKKGKFGYVKVTPTGSRKSRKATSPKKGGGLLTKASATFNSIP